MRMTIEERWDHRPAGGSMPWGTSWTALSLDAHGFLFEWRHANDIRGDDGVWRANEGHARFATAAEVAEHFGEDSRFTQAARRYADADLGDLVGRAERARERERKALEANRRAFFSA